MDRILIAGRVIVFYAQKLLVPWPLAFIYPRWRIDPGVWWQWLFPVAVLVVLITLLAAQKQLGRGPAAAVMLFCGLLFPALGFVNVYPMRFSFVADHFQYHASAAMIALLAAIAWKLASRPAVVLLIPLAVLTAMRAPVYSDSITLWRDTLAKNPDSWMVHTNLSHALVAAADRSGDARLYAEAEEHYLAAYKLDPDIPETNLNAGIVYARRNQIDKALAHLQRALELSPEFPPILLTIGQVYERNHDLDRAIEYYRKALEIDPNYVDANYRIGGALIAAGRYDQAAQHLRQAVQIDPRHAEAWLRLGFAQRQLGQMEAAEQSFRTALQLRPELARQILRR
jgi:tetratricopeptide (TPR) repeat protein